MSLVAAYFALALTSFIAGTCLPFLPGSSEIAMAAFLAAGEGPAWAIIVIAVMANAAGAGLNYLAGRGMASLSDRHWHVRSAPVVGRVEDWFRRYGVWTVGFCGLPVFGDAITVAAGAARADPRLFGVLLVFGKLLSHVAVAAGFQLAF
jgi:membrane protein YqaA with SNARE-associated domain